MSAAEAQINQLAAALRYAQLGLAVFPLHTPDGDGCSCSAGTACTNIGKHPRTAHGLKDATTDEKVIRGWWRTWPAANIGLVCGTRSGFWVLDVDPDHGGESTLAAHCAKHGPLPATVEAMTGSGGRHLLFALPDFPIRNKQDGKTLGAGLDVRGDGGYIVAAPSLHKAGGTYEWQPDAAPGQRPLAPAPAWLLEMLKPKPQPAPAPPQRERPRLAGDNTLQRASAYLAKCEPAISGSHGHDTAWKAALHVVRGFGLSESEAYGLLATEYNPRCSPPWSERELRHKVQSAANDGRTPIGYLRDAERPNGGAMPPPRATPQAEQPASAEAPRKTRLNLQPVEVLLAEEIPPTQWLFEPYIEEGSIGAIVAPPNLGKTLLAFWVATLVAKAGRRVAIIEEEGGKRGFQKRMSRALAAVPGTTGIHYAFKQRINLMKPEDVLAMCDELQGYDFVVLDSFARVTTGLEENDTKEMGLVVDRLDLIRNETRAAVWSVHHSGKAKWKAGEVPRIGDGRGSSAFEAGMDTVLGLAPVKDREPGIVQFELHITKQRDEDNQVPPQHVRILMTGPAAVVEMSDVTPSDAAVIVGDDIVQMVLEVVRHAGREGISKKRIEDSVRGSHDRKHAALIGLRARGEIEEVQHGKYTRWRVPEPPRTSPPGTMDKPPRTSPAPLRGGESGSQAGERSGAGDPAGEVEP